MPCTRLRQRSALYCAGEGKLCIDLRQRSALCRTREGAHATFEHICTNAHVLCCAGEGAHATFAPRGWKQRALAGYAEAKFGGHVEIEHVSAGDLSTHVLQSTRLRECKALAFSVGVPMLSSMCTSQLRLSNSHAVTKHVTGLWTPLGSCPWRVCSLKTKVPQSNWTELHGQVMRSKLAPFLP
eukprot:738282-Pelagomonas_calceolata.AAC.3